MKPTSGIFYRIAFAQYADQVLDGAIHPEGRFHHDGQAALYASPSPETAAIAIDIYLKDNDAPRVMIPICIEHANLVDLRDHDICAKMGINPIWPSVPWSDERAAGKDATSWKASDIVRDSGADGMIYASRRAPERWHIVLFRWNQPGTAMVRVKDAPTPWSPG